MAAVRGTRILSRLGGGYLAAEAAAFAHFLYAKRHANRAQVPKHAVADADYRKQFLALARCNGSQASVACKQFVQHAFFGVPAEALPRAAVATWLCRNLGLPHGGGSFTDGGSAVATELEILDAALGPNAPGTKQHGEEPATDTHSFMYGEGPVEAFYKPLPLRVLTEFQRLRARRRLVADGFVEHQCEQVKGLRFWERWASTQTGDTEQIEPPLVVLHGYGRGLASPLFEHLVPRLHNRSLIIVDCSWLTLGRVPVNGDVTQIPAVMELVEAIVSHLSFGCGSNGSRGSRSSELSMAKDCNVAEFDLLAHSFGTAVASALVRELAARASASAQNAASQLRRVILMDPMCFMPGITKQAQLLRRSAGDLVAELSAEAGTHSFSGGSAQEPGPPPFKEALAAILSPPENHECLQSMDEAAAARDRRHWIVFQAYLFKYFIFRDLVYNWINVRLLHGHEYLDRGHLRDLNRTGRLLTVLAETDAMIPSLILREELSNEAPANSHGGVLWLPTVGHGACQHRDDVATGIIKFLSASA